MSGPLQHPATANPRTRRQRGPTWQPRISHSYCNSPFHFAFCIPVTSTSWSLPILSPPPEWQTGMSELFVTCSYTTTAINYGTTMMRRQLTYNNLFHTSILTELPGEP